MALVCEGVCGVGDVVRRWCAAVCRSSSCLTQRLLQRPSPRQSWGSHVYNRFPPSPVIPTPGLLFRMLRRCSKCAHPLHLSSQPPPPPPNLCSPFKSCISQPLHCVVLCCVVLCCVVLCCVVLCCVVLCCVVLCCGVVWCGVVWCGVVWCVVLCCVVLCCVVLCCVVLCCVVLCCVVLRGVVWCAEGAVTRRQWLGCLPMGTGKQEGCVSKCALCASVLLYSRTSAQSHLAGIALPTPVHSHTGSSRPTAPCVPRCTISTFCAVPHWLVLCTALHCVCPAALHL